MSKAKRRTCLNGCGQFAKLPKDEKIFCSQRCGFEYAVHVNGVALSCQSEMGSDWCDAHGKWFSGSEDRCSECQPETSWCPKHRITYQTEDGCEYCETGEGSL